MRNLQRYIPSILGVSCLIVTITVVASHNQHQATTMAVGFIAGYLASRLFG
ncbi:hypothetical protein [Azospirillum sp. B4]|uniref:hypothetical protein n=1 Tax=Azospirillum sp. B4 TaxID=95605 RepID=UPI00034DA83E|nr:hypothetical protein [Azospirillum sp. B4]